eukprot:TRINITY_DN2777_c0_g1::TRINITY_DN2777_c0_g1_i1::g.27422::m.27422 TRINITY_DN2777_c0_g1::TRINITY_DN2777_c0_g1_i1::g.27422  ORF type:complete len:783 (-),score=147.45,sp/Q9FLV9/SLAH3_ARATH/32.09/4e-50,SLAC1/PF03595.12/9e-30 TRINITY_DN2777_c0_g1_i1:225-2573(-)
MQNMYEKLVLVSVHEKSGIIRPSISHSPSTNSEIWSILKLLAYETPSRFNFGDASKLRQLMDRRLASITPEKVQDMINALTAEDLRTLLAIISPLAQMYTLGSSRPSKEPQMLSPILTLMWDSVVKSLGIVGNPSGSLLSLVLDNFALHSCEDGDAFTAQDITPQNLYLRCNFFDGAESTLTDQFAYLLIKLEMSLAAVYQKAVKISNALEIGANRELEPETNLPVELQLLLTEINSLLTRSFTEYEAHRDTLDLQFWPEKLMHTLSTFPFPPSACTTPSTSTTTTLPSPLSFGLLFVTRLLHLCDTPLPPQGGYLPVHVALLDETAVLGNSLYKYIQSTPCPALLRVYSQCQKTVGKFLAANTGPHAPFFSTCVTIQPSPIEVFSIESLPLPRTVPRQSDPSLSVSVLINVGNNDNTHSETPLITNTHSKHETKSAEENNDDTELVWPSGVLGPSLGISAQALLWKQLSFNPSMSFLSIPPEVNEALWYSTLAIGAVCFTLYLHKVIFHWSAFQYELHHNVRVNLIFPGVVALMLMTLAVPPSVTGKVWNAPIDQNVFYAWVAILGGLEFYLYGEWLMGDPQRGFSRGNPAFNIAIVGNFVIAIVGAQAQCVELATFFFCIGSLTWIVMVASLFGRNDTGAPGKLWNLDPKFHPVIFLFVTPPSVASVAATNITGGLNYVSRFFFFVALYFYILVGVRNIRHLWRVPFNMSYWAYTYPLAASSIAAISYHKAIDTEFTKVLACMLSFFSAAFVFLLCVPQTVRLFWQDKVRVRDPVKACPL